MRLRLLFLALSLFLISGGCISPSKPEPTPTHTSAPTPTPTIAPTLIPSPSPTVARGQDGVLRLLGEDEDIETWDPHRTESSATHRPLSFIYSKLFRLPESDGPVPYDRPPLPDLVERWEMTSPTTYVFHLRQGVRFHDKPPVSGRELVAEDVRYSLERFRDSSLPSRAWWRAVDSIEAPDPYTVKVNLSEPFAPLLFYLGGHFSWVMAREVADSARGKPEGAIGTGAWFLKDYVPGARAVFQRHPAYFVPGVPSVDEIQWQTVRDTLTRRAALISGLLDVMPVDKELLAELKQGAPDLQVYEYMPMWGPGAQALALRSDVPPFADAKVRRAVSLSIHRQSWRDIFIPEKAVDNAGPVPEALGWGLTLEQLGAEGRYSHFDVAQARQLMAEAGYPQGLSTYLSFPQDRGYERKVEVLADFLLAVGIKAELRSLSEEDYLKAVRGDYEGILLYGLPSIMEPDEWFFLQLAAAGGRNVSRARDPSLDEMLRRQAGLMDRKQRSEALEALQKYAAEQVYYLYLPSAPQLEVASPRVKGYHPIPGYDLGSLLLGVSLER